MALEGKTFAIAAGIEVEGGKGLFRDLWRKKITIVVWLRQSMVEPLPEDSAYLLSMIRRHPGVNGRVIMIETGFAHDRCIDAIKVLVLDDLVFLNFDNPEDWLHPRFEICRFFPRV